MNDYLWNTRRLQQNAIAVAQEIVLEVGVELRPGPVTALHQEFLVFVLILLKDWLVERCLVEEDLPLFHGKMTHIEYYLSVRALNQSLGC